MANFPRLDELAVAANTRGLFDGMLVYCDRENAKDLEFANGLHNLWAELLERTNERQLFIAELEGLCPSVRRYKILKCLNEDRRQDLIQLLELRKVILGKYWQVSRKIALVETISRVNELKLLTSELNAFGGPLAVQCAKFLKQLSQKEVLRMLDLRKMIAEMGLMIVYKFKL
ncbi:hypothetical protein Tco_0162548 [Tanacetum coccineum]